MAAGEDNLGWIERGNLFKTDNDQRKAFRPSGITLIGRLLHDLVSCETGLPPNTKAG